jgi:hypothetical protein
MLGSRGAIFSVSPLEGVSGALYLEIPSRKWRCGGVAEPRIPPV